MPLPFLSTVAFILLVQTTLSYALECPGAPDPQYPLVVADGFNATTVLGNLTEPRGITLDSRGNLLVVQRSAGISVHTVDDSGCVTASKMLIEDSELNHGIDLVEGKLYASSASTAWVWDYNAVNQTVENRTTLITGMEDPDGHSTRTVWLSRKYPNQLVVSRGSHDNIDLESYSSDTARSIVKVFDLNTTNVFNYTTDGKVLGYGLRNDVGIIEDKAGNIISIENSMDQAYRLVEGQQTDVHNDNPAEPVWNLGNPKEPCGCFYGYPYCYFVWEPSSFPNKTFQVGDWFVQEENDTVSDAWCSQVSGKQPLALLPPHTAPLDIKFGVGNDSNLYAALHGSWNRDPPQGYKVVAIPGNFTKCGEWTAGSFRSTEYQDILTNTDENDCDNGCFRPVGLAWSSNGTNLYVSSDKSGEVFLVQKA